MIIVIDFFGQLFNAALSRPHAPTAFKIKRLVTTPTVRIPSPGCAGNHRRCTGAGATAHTACNAICAPCSISTISAISAAARRLPGQNRHLPSVSLTDLDTPIGTELDSLRVRIGTTKSSLPDRLRSYYLRHCRRHRRHQTQQYGVSVLFRGNGQMNAHSFLSTAKLSEFILRQKSYGFAQIKGRCFSRHGASQCL